MLLSYIYFLRFLYILWKFIRNRVFFTLLKLNKESLTCFIHTSLYRYFLDFYYLSSLALDRLLHTA